MYHPSHLPTIGFPQIRKALRISFPAQHELADLEVREQGAEYSLLCCGAGRMAVIEYHLRNLRRSPICRCLRSCGRTIRAPREERDDVETGFDGFARAEGAWRAVGPRQAMAI